MCKNLTAHSSNYFFQSTLTLHLLKHRNSLAVITTTHLVLLQPYKALWCKLVTQLM